MKTRFNISFIVPVWLDRFCSWPACAYRKFKYGYPYRKIPLGQGLFTIVDPADFYWLNNYQWIAYGKPDCPYAVRFDFTTARRLKSVSMHREIMKPRRGLLVDHHNGDSLDNRRDNLRLATHWQNTCNRRKTKSKTSSKFIGVYFDKRTGKWAAKIKCKSNTIWLGRFVTEIDAARAYDEAAKKYHGEFASLNFPQDKKVTS